MPPAKIQAPVREGGIHTIRMPLWDPQQEAPAAYCQQCRGEIYREETIFLWEGQEVCPDCFRAAVQRLLEAAPRLLAQELGVETHRCVEERPEGRRGDWP